MLVRRIVEASLFKNAILILIVFNGAILGLQTYKSLPADFIAMLDLIDTLLLSVFVIELGLKFIAYRSAFFKEGWNNFDFIIVLFSVLPGSESLSIMRAFRILRVLRLITSVNSIRRVVSGMLVALPGVGSVAGLLLIFFYIGAVISTNLFGDAFPLWFGSLEASMYTLFQVMTLESWSMGIVRPVMDIYPYAWAFFVPFITITTFTVLNLFIAIIVDAMATIKQQEAPEDAKLKIMNEELSETRKDLHEINAQLAQLLVSQKKN
jgi:voltage-gated sodium channel